MGMLKNYLLRVITVCAPDNGFAQEAIEHAILTNQVTLTGDFDIDQQAVRGRYDSIIEKYHLGGVLYFAGSTAWQCCPAGRSCRPRTTC